MGLMKHLAIGVITLSTLGQTGWGQNAEDRTDRETTLMREIERLRNQNKALATRLTIAGVDVDEALKMTTPFIDVSFPGGSLASLVDRLKERDPRANLILRAGAGDVTLPAFEAFEVTPAGAIWVAKSVAGPEWNLRVMVVDPGDGSEPTTVVHASEVRPESEARSWMAPSKAWNMTRWVGNDDPERIDAAFAAIQVGLEAFDADSVVLKYHEPTKVLMARGNQAQINFIDSILVAASEMPTELNPKPLAVAFAPRTIAESSKRLAELEGEMAVLAARADMYHARIRRLTEEGVGEDTLAAQRVELAEIEALRKMQQHEQKTLQTAVENARKALADYEAKENR